MAPNKFLYCLKLYFLVYLFVGACKTEKKSEQVQQDDQTEETTNLCFEKSEKEMAITSILETEEFQTFLHPEVAGRLPIRIVKNDFITSDLEIMSNGQQVEFTDSLELPDGKVHRINITNIDCEPGSFSYSVFYPIEGAIIQGEVTIVNSEWVATVDHVGEKN